MIISFRVNGTPQGKGRPRFRRMGNFVSTYTPEKSRAYEKTITEAARVMMLSKKPISNPVKVTMRIYLEPPKSWSNKKKQQALDGIIKPTTKPDIDNIVKGYFDAINGVVWDDDKQVIGLDLEKAYSSVAGVRVTVKELGNKPTTEKLL